MEYIPKNLINKVRIKCFHSVWDGSKEKEILLVQWKRIENPKNMEDGVLRAPFKFLFGKSIAPKSLCILISFGVIGSK